MSNLPADFKPDLLAADIARLIQRRRTELGMSQEELALASGVGRRFINELEGGKPNARLGLTLMVLASLGIRISAKGPS